MTPILCLVLLWEHWVSKNDTGKRKLEKSYILFGDKVLKTAHKRCAENVRWRNFAV